MEGKTARGASSPAKPALHIPGIMSVKEKIESETASNGTETGKIGGRKCQAKFAKVQNQKK
jgi:hypothetical protein